MTRLIDADALLDFLDVGHLRPPTEICFSELMMKNIIELMPTVDAVPVRHAYWIRHEDWEEEGGCGWECSECGMGSEVDYKFCMRCGARMDEE